MNNQLMNRCTMNIGIWKGKHVVVLGRSNLVGLPLSLLLLHYDASVTICHTQTQNTQALAQQADILVSAMGIPQIVTKSWIKPGAVVLDVGISYIPTSVTEPKYEISGDVDFHNVKHIASKISPVPGGVGPMTVAMLLRNTVENAKHRMLQK